MKVYIDLGSYTGDTIKDAMHKFKDFDMFVGFEPIPSLFKKCVRRFKDNPKVRMHKLGASNKKEKVKLYLDYYAKEKMFGMGSTLLKSKRTGRIKKSVRISRYEKIKCVDFSEYIKNNFAIDDYIVLKINVEGKEYDILEHMISESTIKYIKIMYCSWHIGKMRNPETFRKRQEAVLEKLYLNNFELVSSKRLQDKFKLKEVEGNDNLHSVCVE